MQPALLDLVYEFLSVRPEDTVLSFETQKVNLDGYRRPTWSRRPSRVWRRKTGSRTTQDDSSRGRIADGTLLDRLGQIAAALDPLKHRSFEGTLEIRGWQVTADIDLPVVTRIAEMFWGLYSSDALVRSMSMRQASEP